MILQVTMKWLVEGFIPEHMVRRLQLVVGLNIGLLNWYEDNNWNRSLLEDYCSNPLKTTNSITICINKIHFGEMSKIEQIIS